MPICIMQTHHLIIIIITILIIILMTVIPILASAQAKSGDDSAPSNAPAAADSLLPDPGPTNVPDD